MRHQQSHRNGFSIIEVLVATGIIGVISVGAMKVLSNQLRMAASSSRIKDLTLLRTSVQFGIDCVNTVNFTPTAANCSSTSGAWGTGVLRLLNLSGTDVLPGWNGGAQENTWNSWGIKAACSYSEKSVVVRAVRRAPGGAFASDPTNPAKLFNWANPNGLLFGGGLTLCRRQFNNPASSDQHVCPNGWYAIGPNVAVGSPTNDCAQFPAGDIGTGGYVCPTNYVAVGMTQTAGSPVVICRPQPFAGTFEQSALPSNPPPASQTVFDCLSANIYTGNCSCPAGYDQVESGGLLSYCISFKAGGPNYPGITSWHSGQGCGANRPTSWESVPNLERGMRTGARTYSCTASATTQLFQLTSSGVLPYP